MERKLKVDNGFTPCPTDAGDEIFPNGILNLISRRSFSTYTKIHTPLFLKK